MSIESRLVDLVAQIAPWAAPIPTAYLVGRATVLHLAWPVEVGIVAAVIIESLGLATTSTALALREYNASKRQSDPAAPFPLAAGLVGAYLVVAVLLTVALDTVPVLAVYAPAIFPFLSLAGMTVLALRHDQARRVAAIADSRAAAAEERRQARESKRQATAIATAVPAAVAEQDGNGGTGGNGDRPHLTFAEFCRAYPEVADLTGRQVAALAGTSERTGRNWLALRKKERVI